MKKQYFSCECGEKVKLTKHKLDTEKGMLLKMSDEEIENFRHNKKCTDCIAKEDEGKKEVKVWRASILCQDDEADEEGEDVVDGVNTSYFKNKNDALDFLCINPLLAAAFLDFRFRISRPVARAKLIQMG